MRKIMQYALFASVVPLGLSISSEASAKSFSPLINKANDYRASAWCLNKHARSLEKTVGYYKKRGINPVGLTRKARKMRQGATSLALRSNQVAKQVFGMGYVRPAYPVAYYS